MDLTRMGFRVLARAGIEFEQIVYAEVLVPDVPNVYGDIYTRQAIIDFQKMFEEQGYGIDVEHNNVNVDGTDAVVIDSFIAGPEDTQFIEGSWVVGMHILDDTLWQQVLDGELNGYSYEALCELVPVVIQNLRDRQIEGTTEPHPIDGHTHSYLIIVDVFNRPIAGGTGITDSHSHTITSHTYTDESAGHIHRYQVLVESE